MSEWGRVKYMFDSCAGTLKIENGKSCQSDPVCGNDSESKVNVNSLLLRGQSVANALTTHFCLNVYYD